MQTQGFTEVTLDICVGVLREHQDRRRRRMLRGLHLGGCPFHQRTGLVRPPRLDEVVDQAR